jgi:hypothetical protein
MKNISQHQNKIYLVKRKVLNNLESTLRFELGSSENRVKTGSVCNDVERGDVCENDEDNEVTVEESCRLGTEDIPSFTF